MSVVRIHDDEKGVTPTFEMFPVLNETASKKAGRPIFDEIELCRIYIAGNKQTIVAVPAHDIWRYEKRASEYGTEEKIPVTYAMRFNKQYLEFKSGGPQSFSGTLLSELPFLSQAKRLELKALNVHTAETLATLDGNTLKMLGPGGRELKNQAMAYLESAAKSVTSDKMADELSKRDAQIAELQRKLDSIGNYDNNSVHATMEQANLNSQETTSISLRQGARAPAGAAVLSEMPRGLSKGLAQDSQIGRSGEEENGGQIAGQHGTITGQSDTSAMSSMRIDGQAGKTPSGLQSTASSGMALPVTSSGIAPQPTVENSTVEGFLTFEDEDLRTWLSDAGETVDGRWSRKTLLEKAQAILKKSGKLKTAA